jgi:hypothetical protein
MRSRWRIATALPRQKSSGGGCGGIRALLERSVYLDRAPHLKASLSRSAAPEATASYVYWSIEDFGRKQVIRVTHVVIVRPGLAGLPDVLVGSTQIYASHYVDAALAVTTLERGAGDTAFLGYLYRARRARECPSSQNREGTHRRRRRTALSPSAQAPSGRLNQALQFLKREHDGRYQRLAKRPRAEEEARTIAVSRELVRVPASGGHRARVVP